MTTAAWLTLTGVSLAQALAMISPGPALLLVSRAAASQSRGAGLATGLGVATAAALWAVGATLGVAVLLARLPSLYAAIQLTGAVYLIFLGLAAWRDNRGDAPAEPVSTATGFGRQAILRGFSLSLSNPKIVLFYGGIFVSLLPADAPLWERAAALLIVIAQEYLWYSVVVATMFSRPGVQAAYRRVRGRIERVMGAVFITLGARIAALAQV